MFGSRTRIRLLLCVALAIGCSSATLSGILAAFVAEGGAAVSAA